MLYLSNSFSLSTIPTDLLELLRFENYPDSRFAGLVLVNDKFTSIVDCELDAQRLSQELNLQINANIRSVTLLNKDDALVIGNIDSKTNKVSFVLAYFDTDE